MSDILRRVQTLVRSGDYLMSRHGFRELAADDIVTEDALGGIEAAFVVEEYLSPAKNLWCWFYSIIASNTLGLWRSCAQRG
jgi:hypothetical protein